MSISKLITILITHIFLVTIGFGQIQTIDSLKKILASLHDSARVDCLNTITEKYIGLPDWFAPLPTKTEMDTAEIFNQQALEEAKKINYFYGIARANSLKAELAFEKYNNYLEAVKLSRQAIYFYEKSTNKKWLNRTYWRLGTALHSQSIFDDAVNAYDTSFDLSKKTGDSLYIFYAVITAANVLSEKGDYIKSFEKALVLHQLITATTDTLFKQWELGILGGMYFALEDYTTALRYYHQAHNLNGPADLAITFALNKQFDSARKYFNQVVADTGDARSLRFYLKFRGEYYMYLGDYQKALPNLLRSCNYNIQQNDVNQIMQLLIDISKTHLGLHKNDSAFQYAHKALAIAKKTGAKQFNRDACKILSSVYDYRHQTDSAYFYYKEYNSLNDSLLNDQLKGRVAGFAFEQKIELLNKEKEIQQVRLQKESLQKKILIAGIVIFFMIAYLLWRNNTHKQKAYVLLRNQKQETDAQKIKVEEALQELKSTQAQLIQSEKMASLGELTAGIAHEIQNPLNFVNNFSEVNKELLVEMKDEIDKGHTDEAKSIANDVIDNQEKINHHGKRADAIVKGMLQHSSISTGQKESTDINALADEYLRLSYHGMRAKDKLFNATIQTDFDESLGKINIIPQDIGRVLLNLYNNAFYALAEKNASTSSARQHYAPTITVTTKRLNDKPDSYQVEIKVKDNGNGISQKVIDKIFQPFFTTKPTGQGTGLGLSLSYDIIKAHGGGIKVETKEGEGAEFIIKFPENKT